MNSVGRVGLARTQWGICSNNRLLSVEGEEESKQECDVQRKFRRVFYWLLKEIRAS